MTSNETIELAAERFVAGIPGSGRKTEFARRLDLLIKEGFKQGAIWQRDGRGFVEAAGPAKPEITTPRHMQFEPDDIIDSDAYKS